MCAFKANVTPQEERTLLLTGGGASDSKVVISDFYHSVRSCQLEVLHIL
jgi:hypothetical protein